MCVWREIKTERNKWEKSKVFFFQRYTTRQDQRDRGRAGPGCGALRWRKGAAASESFIAGGRGVNMKGGRLRERRDEGNAHLVQDTGVSLAPDERKWREGVKRERELPPFRQRASERA